MFVMQRLLNQVGCYRSVIELRGFRSSIYTALYKESRIASIADIPKTWRSVWTEVQRGGHWWVPPSRWSAASVATDACPAVGWRTWAGTLEELETQDKKRTAREDSLNILKSWLLKVLCEQLRYVCSGRLIYGNMFQACAYPSCLWQTRVTCHRSKTWTYWSCSVWAPPVNQNTY